ncbi:TRAP transporter small permease [Yaniella flava]|uniref:TRAP transporter small permease n=1 Tax=Yaniella flava TaxID=287930 RepID=A0ABP5FZN6_9MICC
MFDKIITRIENVSVVTAFLTMTIVYFVNVVSRYVFQGSLSFTTEIVINLAVLLTMVGASAGIRLGTHPGFDLLPSIAKGAMRTGLIILIALSTVAFFVLVLWLGWQMTSAQLAQGRLTPALDIPQWIFSMALPVGAALGAIRAAQVSYIQIRRRTAQTENNNATDQKATA